MHSRSAQQCPALATSLASHYNPHYVSDPAPATPAQVLAQRYSNLGADLSHALAIEETLPAELGAVVAHPSRSTHGSTFRGTCALISDTTLR